MNKRKFYKVKNPDFYLCSECKTRHYEGSMTYEKHKKYDLLNN